MDEPFSIFYAQKNLGGIIEMLKTENNPAFHFFFLHYWIKLFGISAFSVRFPSLLFSSLTSVVILKIGEKFFNLKTGITAALIFTFSTMHIFFSHEARVYSLFSLLTALSLFFFLEIAKNPKAKNNYFFLFFSNLLLIYSHYFGFFVIAIQLFSLLFIYRNFGALKKMLIILVTLLICYIPNTIVFINRFLVTTRNGTWVAPPKLTQGYGFLNLFINNRYNMLVLILILLVSGIILMRQKKISEKIKLFSENISFKIILTWFLVPYFTMFLISFKFPVFIDRYILYTSIPFYLLIASLINYLFEKENYKNIAIVFFTGSLIFTVELNPDNYRRSKEVADKIKKMKNENTIVFIAPDFADLGFAYYYNIVYFKDYTNTRRFLNKENIYPIGTKDDAEHILENRNDDVIYLQAGSEFNDPKNLIYNYFTKKYKHSEKFLVYQIYIITHFYN